MWKFIRDNLVGKKIPNKSGQYTLYNKDQQPIYTCHSKVLKHRLQSYYQKEDYREHPTKKGLRPKIAYFSVDRQPLKQARVEEKKDKKDYRYNYL